MKKLKANSKTLGLEDLSDKLDKVIRKMATKEDVADIRVEMSTKDDIADIRIEMATKRDLNDLDEKFTKKFHEILLATEGLMKPISELKMEYTGMMLQLSRHEEWIKFLAEKMDLKLPR